MIRSLSEKRYGRGAARACLALLTLLLAVAATVAQDRKPPILPDALAKAILDKAGIRATVCEMPRAGDGALAAALARQGVAQVHALAPEAKAVDLARGPAERDDLLGSRVVIEMGTPAQLPLGDWVADLLVIADATDANLRELPPAEARRVLAPYRGTAVVGGPAAGGKLSKEALVRWAKETGGAVNVTEEATGLWAVVRMPALAGADDWTHDLHGSDGNLVSHDTVFGRGPYELQWSNLPYYEGHWDLHLISAGRMFNAQCCVAQENPGLPNAVVAQNAYNGDVLWRRPIAKSFGQFGSLMVATPNTLFLKDNGGVLYLDPETGEEIYRISATDDPAKTCLWLLVSDGVLLVLTGPVQNYPKSALAVNGCAYDAQDAINAQFVCGELTAWDAGTGKELWRFQEEKIDPGKVVASNGRVYLYAKRTYAACLNVKTGKQMWRTDAPIAEPMGAALGHIGGDTANKEWTLNRDGAIVTHDVYFINYEPHHQCQAFSATDGRLLWDRLHGPSKSNTYDRQGISQGFLNAKMFKYPLVIGTTIVDGFGWSPSRSSDLLTGKVGPLNGFKMWGCARFTGTADGLLLGPSGEIYDLNSHQQVMWYNAKTACGSGQFVADGLLCKAAAYCEGCSEWRGFYLTRSTFPQAPHESVRLQHGTASAPTNTTFDASDWLTYRNDLSHRNSSSVSVSTNAAIRWTFSLPAASLGPARPDDAPCTPAVCVGDRIWFGTSQGSIVCLDRQTGAELWRYWTMGRLVSSPTWSQGRLYTGSCDGWVYCLNAANGALLWRYRAAPGDRRIMIWGRLSSAWPVMASVMVQSNTAYAVSGLIGQIGGVSLCALDATTGEPRWEKRMGGTFGGSVSTTDPKELTPSATGQMAWYQGQIWWHAGEAGLYRIDPATGDMTHLDSTLLRPYAFGLGGVPTLGQDIGIMPGGWLVYGGRQFILPSRISQQPREVCGFVKVTAAGVSLTAAGKPVYGFSPDAHRVDSLPVWDDTQTLLSGQEPHHNAHPALYANLADVLDGVCTEKHKITEAVPADRKHAVQLTGRAQGSFFTPLLAGNAIVFFDGDWTQWSVAAISRTDSKTLWKFKLPVAPSFGGLSLTRAGDVLVPLSDGRVYAIGETGKND